ncbi:heterokaryon incompatibility protein-domain-containing protein [Phialemonium atrogriseum]|uniref:Heterokaryon incompatibility protein-domain-containing protein n=1 Tax=Phialemonium atrogriseum TaxID=1093897 RepID=A0AAJ0BTH0_9PEZI|nr:heterokaryon incompatibility protein-domain-containing protein [Phialemonium atrogriseum]KAK1764198.1 heterokaryon incompatibility protein-domain-containing protein [Phialemonium atrogriseum]
MPPLSYSSLRGSRNIRILELSSGSGSDPIQANLIETSVDSAPPFEALSYVWGDATIREEIICDAAQLHITVNLYHALQSLRPPKAKRLIWVDAICINQGDVDERTQQVRLMRDVYSRADRVVVWLGPENDEDVPAAVALVNCIYAACEKEAQSAGRDLASLAVDYQPFAEITEDDLDPGLAGSLRPWNALRRLYSRPWFTRVWCVQEIVLARSSTVLVGPHSLSWLSVGVVASWLNTRDVASDFDAPAQLEKIPYFNAYCMFDANDVAATLTKTLEKYRDFNATDPRDKVFGLLGLLDGEADTVSAELVVVDYRLEVWEVYASVMKAAILRARNLAALSLVKHPQVFDGDDPFPSWVARWDGSTDVMVLHDESLAYPCNACGDDHPLGDFEPDDSGAVEVRGVVFDTVAFTTEMMDIDLFKETRELPNHPLLEVWNECTANPGPYESSGMTIVNLAYTFAAGLTIDYAPWFILETEERLQFFADYIAYIQHLLGNSTVRPGALDPSSVSFDGGDRQRYKVAASRACDQRRFFKTTRGNYGLGPACMRESDVLVVLHGGSVPYILRPVRDRFRFLGEAYADDIMHGEAFGELSDQCSEERAFNLF